MDWSREDTIRFLELFEKERIIWDPKNKSHKNLQKINDAWSRLCHEMCRPITELKAKKNSLMATFRKHLRCKKQSMKSGAGLDDIYQPIWPYFEIMEQFLASVYMCDKTINTEEGIISSPPPSEDELKQDSSTIEHNDEYNNDQNNTTEQNQEESRVQNKLANDKKKFKPPISQQRKRLHPEIDIHKNINNAVSNLNTLLMNKKENDECDIYAQLLATRLREYSKQEQRQIMHRIDGFLLANPPRQLQNASPYFSSTPSPTTSLSSFSYDPPHISSIMQPQQSVQISIPDRPSSQNRYTVQTQQSPVQISIPDRPSSQNRSYTMQPQQSPIPISIPEFHSSQNQFNMQTQPSPVQITIPDRPPSKNRTYTKQTQESPVQISIPDHHSSYSTYPYRIDKSSATRNKSSQPTTVSPRISVISQKIIQPSGSQSIIDKAYLAALNK